MLNFPDWCYTKLPSKAVFWMVVWVSWFVLLWYLSSTNHAPKNGPEIPHLDKVVHFGYFMIGGFCLANFLHLKTALNWKLIIICTLIVGSLVGGIDEYHQTFTEGRYGNSIGDWIADTLGTLAGSIYCYFMWRRLASWKAGTDTKV